MKTLGIDIGFAITGWAIAEKKQNTIQALSYGSILTSKDDSYVNRLLFINKELNNIIDTFKPEHLAIESIFYFKNQKTVIDVSQARGSVVLTAALKGLEVFNYTPLQVKMAVTGYGRAEKQQVQKMVKLLYKLNEVPKPDDTADALAIAFCHLNSYR